ncbi:ARL14 effector protein-like [Neocloeon triangulifer]|uniref:ARL14 effector protein-like n=1 Tax=Neocloeon triangulifer TaxID=2078957 RepID=UPI00286F53D0|nr:ARL14 effector protein-like [Neocloeon triangulifer]
MGRNNQSNQNKNKPGDFDVWSNRERRKLARKIYTESKFQYLYNEEGLLVSTGENLCDCNIPECGGCHFPCPKCRSLKCGHDCRKNRKWRYETIKCDSRQ